MDLICRHGSAMSSEKENAAKGGRERKLLLEDICSITSEAMRDSC